MMECLMATTEMCSGPPHAHKDFKTLLNFCPHSDTSARPLTPHQLLSMSPSKAVPLLSSPPAAFSQERYFLQQAVSYTNDISPNAFDSIPINFNGSNNFDSFKSFSAPKIEINNMIQNIDTLPPPPPPPPSSSSSSSSSSSTSTTTSNLTAGNDKEICTGCNNPIEDKFLMKIMQDSWHESCLRCSACHGPLDRSCFIRDKQLLCRADYEKLYSVRCSGCSQVILSQDLVMKVMSSTVYHVECFTCVVCRLPLQKGDQFVVSDSQVYCRGDFEKKFSSPSSYFPLHQFSPSSHQHHLNEWYRIKSDDECSSIDEMEGDQGKGPKRPRTILTTSQRKKFKSSFEVNPKPCRKVREALAAETGLSVRVVQVWFQNQRAKMKKLARRQNDDGQSKKSKPRKDDEEGSEKSSPTSDTGGSIINNDVTSQNVADSSINIFSHQDLYNSITSSMDGYGEINLMSQKSNASSNFILNPIDKLYSMQSSYFTVD